MIDKAAAQAVDKVKAGASGDGKPRLTIGGPAPDPTGRNAVRDAAAAVTTRPDPTPTREQVDAQKRNSENGVLAWIRARRKLQGM